MISSTKKIGFILTLAALVFFIHSTVFAGEKITIRVATLHPVKHIITEDGFKQYAAEITRRTNGKVQFQWYLGGTLVKWRQANEALKKGVIDMALPLDAFSHYNEYPISKGLALPFLFDSSAHVAATYYKLYQDTPELQKELSHIKPLGFFTASLTNWHTIEAPPEKLENFKGLRILCTAKGSLELSKLVGFSPRQMSVSDVSMALQKKLADGIAFPYAALKAFKLTDILSGHIKGLTVGAPMVYAMNLKKWNSLPPDVQEVFESMTESAGNQAATILTRRGQWTEQELRKRGDKFYTLTAEQAAIVAEKAKPIYQEYIDELNKRGMDGQAIFNKFVKYSKETRNNPAQPDEWWGRAGKVD